MKDWRGTEITEECKVIVTSSSGLHCETVVKSIRDGVWPEVWTERYGWRTPDRLTVIAGIS